jgi:signal transduction histidine kinase
VEQVDLSVLVEDLVKMFDSVRDPGVSVEVEVEPGIAVAGDAGQLKQVLWNLWLNGAQSMSEKGGELALSIDWWIGELPQAPGASLRNEAKGERAGGEFATAGVRRWVQISVRDTGTGMPAEVQERMFEPFYTTKHEGTGLGLATVFRIVESHGGMLQVESEVGSGTAFRILLPAFEESV